MGKAKPYTFDAYIFDVLLPDLVNHDKSPAAFLLYAWLWSQTKSVGRDAAFFSYQALTDRTGLSKSAVQRAVAWLARRELIKVTRKSATATPEYEVLAPWKRLER